MRNYRSDLAFSRLKLILCFFFFFGTFVALKATTFGGAAVTQITTVASKGVNNQEILKIAITNSGGGQVYRICQLNFVLQNTFDTDISAAKLYFTGTSGTFSTSNLLSTVSNPSGSISFDFSQAMATTNNSVEYFWLAYDIKSGAADCSNFDAYVPVDGITYTAAGGTCPGSSYATPSTNNPEGNRRIEAAECWKYCSSAATNSSDSKITNVTFNTINKTSPSGCESYTDNTSTSTNVQPNQTHTLSFSMGTCGNNFNKVGAAFIDWNNDGDFDDSGEQVATSGIYASSGTYSTSVTVPSNAAYGATRLRVVCKEGSTAPSACGSYSYGETEEYTIIICNIQAGTASSSNTDLCYNESAQVNLTGYTSGTSIQWQSSTDNSTWTNISGATTSVLNSSGLTVSSWFRARVSSGSCEYFSNTVAFTLKQNSGISSSNLSTIAYNGTANLTLSSYMGSIQWQSSSDSISWSNIPGANTANYATAALTSSTYYRAVVAISGCANANSNSTLITVAPNGTPVWYGTSSSTWSNTANWSGNSLPTSSDNVIIPRGTDNNPSIGITTVASCNNLTIDAGASLANNTITGYLEINGNFTNNGSFSHTGISDLKLKGALNTLGGSGSFSNAKIEISSGANITLTSSLTLEKLNITNNASSSLSLGSNTLSITTTLTQNGVINFNAGTINYGGTTTPTFNGSRFNANTGSIYFNSTSTLFDIQVPGNITYYNLQINSVNGRDAHIGLAQGAVVCNNLTVVSISSGGSVYLDNQLTVNGDVITPTGCTFNTSNNNLLVKGNLAINGSFSAGSSTVTLNGTADQNLTLSNGLTFYTLTINKSTGKAVPSNSFTVSQTLNLSSGALDLNQKTLTVSRSNTGAISRTSGYIISENTSNNSRLKWNIGSTSGNFIFPFGKSDGTYIPLTFNKGTGNIGNVTISTYPTGSTNIPFPSGVTNLNNATPDDNSANTVDRFWQIDKDGASGNATVTVTYAQNEAPNSEIDLKLQRWNGSSWDAPLAGQTNDATNNTITVPGVSNFSPWGGANNPAPLPVKLLHFDASLNGAAVELKWSTLTEINNDYFILYRATAFDSPKEIGRIIGAGNSNAMITYQFIDKTPEIGTNYYNLRQVDFDGKFEDFEIVPIKVDGKNISVTVSPNPAKNHIELGFHSEYSSSSEYLIIDALGHVIQSKINEVNEGLNSLRFDISQLSPGMYFIITNNPSENLKTKFYKH